MGTPGRVYVQCLFSLPLAESVKPPMLLNPTTINCSKRSDFFLFFLFFIASFLPLLLLFFGRAVSLLFALMLVAKMVSWKINLLVSRRKKIFDGQNQS